MIASVAVGYLGSCLADAILFAVLVVVVVGAFVVVVVVDAPAVVGACCWAGCWRRSS